MFANVGWGEMLVLVVVGLVVLGPERLPGAIRWTATALRQARDYLSGMTTQLREDIGPDFDDLRQPLRELQKLRGFTPRPALTKHRCNGGGSPRPSPLTSPLLRGHTPLFTGTVEKEERNAPKAMPPSSPVSEPPV